MNTIYLIKLAKHETSGNPTRTFFAQMVLIEHHMTGSGLSVHIYSDHYLAFWEFKDRALSLCNSIVPLDRL